VFQILTNYVAFWNYEQFRQRSQEPPTQAALLFEEPDPAMEALERAIRYDPKNAEYAYALGSYQHQHLPDVAHPYSENLRHQKLDTAEAWIGSAIMLAPTNAWYYYELGRLSLQREPCEQSTASDSQFRLLDKAGSDGATTCAAARYFEAALQNAPHDAFLQETVGRWLYTYAPDRTSATIEALVAQEVTLVGSMASASKQYAQFLYDIGLDYASDLRKPPPPSSAYPNNTSDVLARLPNILSDSDDRTVTEFGNDDGTPEWRTRLYADTLRVNKIIYVPQDLSSYTAAALKIYMNNGGRADFKTHFSVDNHLIKTFAYTIPRQPDWYEIPFDISQLHGKSSITVYIRTTEASQTENYLQIWGDQDTPTTHSVFNFDTTNDLSFDDGMQTGEYLIRLALKSPSESNIE
jgi:tetratricopeptide (TPR) repeat protein